MSFATYEKALRMIKQLNSINCKAEIKLY